jgi:hypothetical protein
MCIRGYSKGAQANPKRSTRTQVSVLSDCRRTRYPSSRIHTHADNTRKYLQPPSMASHPFVVALHAKSGEEVMADAGSDDSREDQIRLQKRNHVGGRTWQLRALSRTLYVMNTSMRKKDMKTITA